MPFLAQRALDPLHTIGLSFMNSYKTVVVFFINTLMNTEDP